MSYIPFESLFVLGFNLLKNSFESSFDVSIQYGKLRGNYIPKNMYYDSTFIEIRHFRSLTQLFKSSNIRLSKNNPILYFTIKYLFHDDLDMLAKACAPVNKTSVLTMSQPWTHECHKQIRREINSGRIKRRHQNRKHMKILKKWKRLAIRLM